MGALDLLERVHHIVRGDACEKKNKCVIVNEG